MVTREWLTETEAAKVIGMSVGFLRMARCRGKVGNSTEPPPYFKMGDSVRYDRADLEKWIEARRVDRTATLAPTRKRATRARRAAP